MCASIFRQAIKLALNEWARIGPMNLQLRIYHYEFTLLKCHSVWLFPQGQKQPKTGHEGCY